MAEKKPPSTYDRMMERRRGIMDAVDQAQTGRRRKTGKGVGKKPR